VRGLAVAAWTAAGAVFVTLPLAQVHHITRTPSETHTLSPKPYTDSDS